MWTHGIRPMYVSNVMMLQETALKCLRHRHGKALDNDIGVEGLEHVF